MIPLSIVLVVLITSAFLGLNAIAVRQEVRNDRRVL